MQKSLLVASKSPSHLAYSEVLHWMAPLSFLLKTASSTTNTTTAGGVAAGTGVRKIAYNARTHSQLTQFVGELRRTGHNDLRVGVQNQCVYDRTGSQQRAS